MDKTLYCSPCRDLEEWKRLQRERLAERERLNPALREFVAICKHFPDQVAEALQDISKIRNKLSKGV
jgi:hypothetical protein